MTCEETAALLSAYVDRELDVATSLRIETHLAECARCAAALARVEALRSAIGAAGLAYAPPPELAARIRASVGADVAAAEAPAPRVSTALLRRRPWTAGIAAALAAGIAWLVVGPLVRDAGRERIVGEVVAGHVRSLMVDHLVDVPSSDRHTVRPWFNGKIDYAPPVDDFKADGFTLVGGRLDYVDARPVAVLVYKHDPHLVNVFVWPSRAGDAPAETLASQGYALVRWVDHGLEYWAVSDLNARELERLPELIHAAGPRAAAARE